jgi:hypothetical protein
MFSSYLEFRTMDEVPKPSDSELNTVLEADDVYLSVI